MKNILILEDNEDSISMLRNTLADRSFSLQFIKTQENLFKKLSEDVDIIITDLKVPKYSGGVNELVTKNYFQRIHRLVPNTDIIIFTGSSYEYSDKIKVKDFWKMEIGPFFYLNKDLSPEKLILLVIDFCLKSNDNNNHPATSHEKGKVLECLMAWIFRSIDGFFIKTNLQTNIGEVDIMISNEVKNSPFWYRKGDNIPVECRNKKTGKKEGIRSNNEFKAKVQGLSDCKLGFFVSTRGFSREYLDKLVSASGDKYIVPIDDFRIKELVQSTERISLLADYIREVSQNDKSINELKSRSM